MRGKLLLFVLFIASVASTYFHFSPSIPTAAEKVKLSAGSNDNPIARFQQEFMMLRDPVTNKIPADIFRLEQEFAKNLPKKSALLRKNGSAEALNWTSRGPNNVGGRTRALGIDIRTVSPPNITIIAGGVSGGLWRSIDNGANWNLVNSTLQLHSTTCLVHDIRSGKEDTWYAGSGEGIGNSASGGGGYFLGDGIFKSTNNGESWSQLASTVSNSPQSFNSDFEIIWNVAIDPSNL